jgi:hypothetical protein
MGEAVSEFKKCKCLPLVKRLMKVFGEESFDEMQSHKTGSILVSGKAGASKGKLMVTISYK